MYKFIKNRYNIFVSIFALFFLLFGIFFIESIKREKIESYKKRQNSSLAQSITKNQEILIREKQETTLAMAVALSQNISFKEALKNAQKEEIDLKKISKTFNTNTMYKNVWIQLIDMKGRSFARSWSKKRGDDLYAIREDVRIILKDKKMRSTISVGIFSISFKSMVPIFEDAKLIGVVEVITHFNSLEKKLQEQNIDSLVLVDKRFEPRLTHSLTKQFINGYYVANFDPNEEIIDLLKNRGIEELINPNIPYKAYEKKLLVSSNIYNNSGEVIAYFIALSPSNVEQSVIDDINLLYLLYSMLWVVFVSLFVYLLLDRSALSQKLADFSYFKKLVFYFFLFFILFEIALYLFLESEKRLKIESFLDSVTKKHQSAFAQVYAEQKKLSEVLFETTINRAEIKAILSQSDKDRARDELYEKLLPTYELLSKNNLRQLHFHHSDNRSFLRFHRPLKFGDDLSGFRESVAFVNRNREPIDGFEEGRIFNGFRFVFPLHEQSDYLGSVEVSFSPTAMMDELSKNFDYKTEFLMRKSITDEKLMQDESANYTESSLSGFYFEKSSIEHSRHRASQIKLCDEDPKKLKELNAKALKGEAFSFYFCDKKSVITFLPLRNPVTKELSAIFALSSQEEFVVNKERNALMIFLVLSIFNGFMVLFMYRELVGKKKIRDLNSQLQNAQRIAKIGHWELDLRTNQLYWSDEIYTIFEIDKEHSLPSYESFLGAIHPEDREMVDSTYKNSLVDKKPYTISHRLLFDDGRVKYVEENCVNLFDERGKPLVSNGTMQDITSKKLIEQTLESARRHIELIVSASGVGLWELDMRTNTIFWDRHAFEMLGYENEEFSLSYDIWLDLMHPDDRQKTQESLEEQLGSGDSFGLEFRLKHRDGSWFWIDGRGEVVEYDQERRPTKMVGIHIDANRQKTSQSALEKEKQKAEEANRAKSQFLANMSHEIRTPMNAVIGLGTLLEDMELGAKQRDILHKMNSSSKMLLRILNDILDYSKIEAGKLQLEKKAFALKALSSQLELMFEQSAEQKGIGFEIECDEALPGEVIGDEFRILQVLINLLSNAIKFTSCGTVKLHVKLIKRVDDEHASIGFSISDSGIGMSQEQVQNLFRAFEQADTSTTRKYGGTGLGLVISQNILHAMGSDIEAQSREGEGTLMAFEILFEVAQWQRERQSQTLKEESKEVSFKGSRLLVVEDNELNQEVVTLMLESFGVIVDVANNGAEGVEKYFASKEKYDLILMDLQMPVMGGFEASKKIRQRDKEIPIIALTAATMEGDRERVLEAQMNEHLAKPIEKEKLSALLARYIAKTQKDEKIDKSDFAQELQQMCSQLRSAAFMEHEYIESFYEKAKPYMKESRLQELKEALEEFEFDRALEILQDLGES